MMSFAALSLMVLSMLRQVTSIAPRSCPDGPIAAAWYSPDQPLADISWPKYNTLIYSFATTTPDVHDLSLELSNASVLPQFVSEAHKQGVSAQASIGGWTGSLYYSSNIASAENRTAFVKTCVDFVQKYDLDGLNFDWEYPGKQGIGCNVVSPNDTENFLSFLQELRSDPAGSQMTLSAAVPLTPFMDSSGKPSTDVSGFAEVLDYIAIMNYDVFGSWSATVGPNAPLNDTCALPVDQQGSAVSAVKAWNQAGMPLNQTVLGVAAYSHSFSVLPADAFADGSTTDLRPYPKFNGSNQPLGDSDSGANSTDVCGNHQGPSGTFTFHGLVSHEFLDAEGNPAQGIYYRFDDCSQTPYVYNETSQVMISFDDARSFAAKGKYINETGLKGFSIWNSGEDYKDILLDSIRGTVGLDSTASPGRRSMHRVRNRIF